MMLTFLYLLEGSFELLISLSFEPLEVETERKKERKKAEQKRNCARAEP